MIYDVDGPFGWMIYRLRMVLLRREVLIHHRVLVIDCHRRFWLQIPWAKTWVRTYLSFKWMRLRLHRALNLSRGCATGRWPRCRLGSLRGPWEVRRRVPQRAIAWSRSFRWECLGLCLWIAHIYHVMSSHIIPYHIIYSNALMRPQWNDDL